MKVLGGRYRDAEDHKRLRQGPERHKGFEVGKYIMPSPIFFTRHGTNLFLEDIYRGWPVFLFLSGPSTKKLDLAKLNQPGIVVMGINNSPKRLHHADNFAPDLWVEVDSPQNFVKSIWMDPAIMKFCPFCHAEKKMFDNDAWKEMDQKVGDCPNVVHYRRNEEFNHKQFLFEDSINWGCHGKHPGTANFAGCRSVMLAAVRICFALGFRTVFLVGADFSMEVGKENYSFEQDRTKGSVKNNTKTYEALNARFDLLRPIFDKHGFNVFNCNKDSGLKSFDHVPYEDAIAYALRGFPNVQTERTEGLYERKAQIKHAKKKGQKPPGPPKKKGKEKKPEKVAVKTKGISLADLKERVKRVG